MNQSLELVFQYFFAVGSGIGLGLTLTVGLPIVLYKRIVNKGGLKLWRSSSRK